MKRNRSAKGRRLAAGMAVWLSCAGVWATTYYVKPAGDDSALGTSWATALASVTNALNKASAHDEIWVAAGTYKPTTGSDRTQSINLKANVALYGGFAGTETMLSERNWSNNVAILSGDIGVGGDLTDNSYHVVVGATGARLDGFTVQDGFADGAGEARMGGGMYSSGAHPVTANCIFSNNFAIGPNSGGSGGGGAYWYQGTYTTVTVGWYNCVFDGNMASNSTTSASSRGGGLYVKALTNFIGSISNCIFRNNIANGTYVSGSGLALEDAGARVWPAGEKLTIIDCLFSNNVVRGASGYGGGLHMVGFVAPTLLTNCLFVQNEIKGGDNSTGGGAVYLSVSASGQGPQVYTCTFLENRSSYFTGGAVQMATGGGTNALWRDCVFMNNYASNHGGAVHGVIGGTFESCSFVSNTAHFYQGGAVRVSGASATAPIFTNCLFLLNQAGASGQGGGAVSAEAPVTLVDCRVLQNYSASGGGGLLWSGSGGTIRNSSFVSNSTASGNQGYGGVIRLGGAGRVTVEGSTFASNSAGWYGGVIYAPAGSGLTVSDCHFLGNAAVLYYGGAALIETTNAVIRRSVFVGNSASNQYGGALCYRTISTHTSQVANCVFRHNVANYGGAIATYNANLSVSNCTVYTNRAIAANGGGALHHTSASYTALVENCIFWNNVGSAAPNAVYQPVGGGIGVSFSCVQGGMAGEENVDGDPLFDDLVYLHLKSASGVYRGGYFSGGTWGKADAMSPLIDLGHPNSAFELEPSHNGGRINLGAYGNTPVASKSLVPVASIFITIL